MHFMLNWLIIKKKSVLANYSYDTLLQNNYLNPVIHKMSNNITTSLVYFRNVRLI